MTSAANRSSDGITSSGSMPTGAPQPTRSVAGSVSRNRDSSSTICCGGPTRYDWSTGRASPGGSGGNWPSRIHGA